MTKKIKQKKGKKNVSNKKQQVKIVYRDPPKPKNTMLGDFGALAGNAVSKFFGLGSYSLKQNSVMDAWDKQVPFMHSTNEKIVFRHREFITDISGSSGFTSRVFNVNAGMEETFPYLAQIATNFEEYQFKGLVFEFKSTSATALNSTNTALGTVVLAAQYRADSAVFTNKMQMENSVWAATTRPSENVFLPIECAPDERPMKCGYIRTGQLAAGQDVKFYDLAKVTVASVGMQATSVIGELWATYEVELSKPALISQGGASNETLLYFATAGITSASVLGTTGTSYVDTIGVSITNLGQKLNLPIGIFGSYRATLIVSGTSGALGSTFTVTYTNCSALNAFPTGALTPNAGSNFISGGTSGVQIIDFAFTVPDPTLAASLSFGSVSIPASPVLVQLEISQVPSTYPINPTT